MLADLFAAIDRKDADAFASFLDAGCRFRFGNAPVVTGAENIRAYVAGFFESIAAVTHRIDAQWTVANGMICHGTVTYERKDGRPLSVPFANILRTGGDLIDEYLIFVDASALYD